MDPTIRAPVNLECVVRITEGGMVPSFISVAHWTSGPALICVFSTRLRRVPGANYQHSIFNSVVDSKLTVKRAMGPYEEIRQRSLRGELVAGPVTCCRSLKSS